MTVTIDTGSGHLHPPSRLRRFKRGRVFLAGLLLGLASASAWAQENLLPDGDFETGKGGWNIFVPAESQGKGCQFNLVPDNPHGGTSCAQLESTDFARYAMGAKPIPVAAGDHYRVTAWVRGDEQTQVKKGEPGFVLRLTLHSAAGAGANNFNVVLGNAVSLGNAAPKSAPLSPTWTKTEVVIVIPSNVNALGCDAFVHYAKGALYLDDISIEKVDSSVAATPLSGAGVSGAALKGPPPTTDDYLLNAFDLDLPGMEKVKAAVAAKDLAAVQKAYLDYRRTASTAKWKIMPSNQPAKPTAQDDPIADDTVTHKIHNLWYDMQPKVADMGVGTDFQWFRNPLPPGDPNYTNNWMSCVISRTQFWENLADAYWKTQNEKYAQAWVEQMESFARDVPLDYTKNDDLNYQWSPLDAANRMFESWPFAYYHFLNSPSFTPEANWIYTKQIRDHASLLMAGLNDPKRTGNWITAECCGLYTAGILYPEIKESAQWRQIAMDRFVVELNKLVPPDGMEAELSPGYDTSTIEQFTTPAELGPLNNLPVPADFLTRLVSMHRALVLIMDQSGNVVPTNDSWIINAMAWAPRGLKIGDDPVLAWAASHGRKGTAPPDSTRLPYAGFYAMRSGWKPDDLFLFFRGGPIGIGHQHEEDLEVVLRAWNKTLLYDPGTYAYDKSENRHYVLGTSSHSTILVDGKWQHAGESPLPTAPVSNPWATTPLFDYVASTFDKGYQDQVYAPINYLPVKWIGALDPSVTHTRHVLYLRPYYAVVLDTLDGTGSHTYDNLFQMDAPAATVDPTTHAVVSQRKDGVQLALYPLEQENMTAGVVVGHSTPPMAGWFPLQNRATATVDFQKKQDAPAIFGTFLYPYQGAAAPPNFQAQPLTAQGDNVWGQSFSTPQEKAEVVMVKDDKTEPITITSNLDGAVQVSAAGWTLRQPAGGTQVWQGGWGVQSYQDAHTAFTLDKPGSLAFGPTGNSLMLYNGGDAPITATFTQPFAATATAAPGAWTQISAQGAAPATTAPTLFPPFLAGSSLPGYDDYLKAQPAGAGAGSASIKIKAADFTAPPSVGLITKIGVDDKVITRWGTAGAEITAPVQVPQAGWYRVTLHYCSAGGSLISILIDGKIPFAEAENFPLDSTLGVMPSDGMSTFVDDWHDAVLGSGKAPAGWKIYLPAGAGQVTLRQEGGSANLAWLSLDPAQP